VRTIPGIVPEVLGRQLQGWAVKPMPAQIQAFGLEKKADPRQEVAAHEQPRAMGPTPERHETVTLPVVLMLSIVGHGLVAAALAFVPRDASASASHAIEFEVSMTTPVPLPIEPAKVVPEVIESPVVTPPAEPESVRTPPQRERIARASEPEQAVAAPAPEPSAPAPIAPLAPAAIDDVFGAPALLHANATGTPELGSAGGGGAGGVGTGASRAGVGGVGNGAGDGRSSAGPSDEDIRRARRAYASRIRDLLGGAAHYPMSARRSGVEGRVVVGLRIAEDGRLLAVRIASSCGFPMLDEAALAAANDLSRLPAPPELVAWNTRDELRVPIVFELSR
jgi:protein TonB